MAGQQSRTTAPLLRSKLLKKTEKEFKDKPEKLIRYIELYVEYNGDNIRAWKESGYHPGSSGRSMQVARANWKLVERLIKNKIGSHVPMALAGIVALATGAKTESVRLKALQDILFRAGYDAPIQIQTETKANDLANQELESELTQLLARVRKADNTKVINHVPPATSADVTAKVEMGIEHVPSKESAALVELRTEHIPAKEARQSQELTPKDKHDIMTSTAIGQ